MKTLQALLIEFLMNKEQYDPDTSLYLLSNYLALVHNLASEE
jgi:hypothetical protein